MVLFFGKRTASYFARANFVISSDFGVVLNLQFMFRAGGGRSACLKFPHATETPEADASYFSTDARQFCADHQIKSPQRLAVRFPAWLVDGETKTQQHFSSPIGSPGRECHVSEEAFSTAVCRCYRHVIRGTDDRAAFFLKKIFAMTHDLGRVVADGRALNETNGLDLAPPAGPLGGPYFVILHFDAVNLKGAAKLTVNLGYGTDVFNAASGPNFWSRPADASKGSIKIRITGGKGTARLKEFGIGEPTRSSDIGGGGARAAGAQP